MRERSLAVAVVVVMLLAVASACGSGDQSVGARSAAAADQPGDADNSAGDGPDPAVDPVDTAAADTAATDGGTDESGGDPLGAPLPTSADPCTEPVDFSAIASDLEGDGYITNFTAAGEPRSMTVKFSSDDAAIADDAVIVVMFHGAGGTNEWSESIWDTSFLPELARQRPVIAVMAQALVGVAGAWPPDTYVNTAYPQALRATLSESFCLQRTPVVVHGTGQGIIVALNGYCTGSFPADALVFFQGMAKLLDCPADPVPIITFDIYEFNTLVGHTWDGSWTPPMAEIAEMTGGIQPTPEDLGHWAARYGCEDEPIETVLPIESDSGASGASRPITVLTVPNCVEPIVAIGGPSVKQWSTDAPFFVEAEVLDVVNPVMLAELTAALE